MQWEVVSLRDGKQGEERMIRRTESFVVFVSDFHIIPQHLEECLLGKRLLISKLIQS